MRPRFQPWQLAVLVVLLAATAIGVAQWQRNRQVYDASRLLQSLPPDRSVHVYIDFSQLRASGLLDLLAGSKTTEEADYTRFVEQTGFDYRSDLEAVAAAFSGGNVYLAVRGRFDWKRLSNYAGAQGGFCQNSICTMPASREGRHISFYPLKSDVLALAVSAEERGVNMIGPYKWKKPPQTPPGPVWVLAPAFAFADLSGVPAGTRSFFSPLARAQTTEFSAGPATDNPQRFQIRVDVTCNSTGDAAELSKQLSSTTDLLHKMFDRDRLTPNPADLSGVLVAGRFEQHDARVTGIWPIERSFLQALVAGKIE